TPVPGARGPCPRRGPCAIVAAMKIARLESLHADAGQRNFDFLKITTDDGLVGWSEYNESFGGAGVSAVIDGLAPQLVGRDPRAYESLVTLLYAVRRQAAGGIAQQAIGAIENALLDLKTNVFILGRDPYLHSPGFARRGPGFPELNAERSVVKALRDQLAAFREGVGPDVDILVDLNFNFKTEGFLKVARAIEPFDILWVEIDTRDPKALAYIRRSARIPVASCECLFGRRDYRPYFEHQAVDVAIVDTPWNGVAESVKIAAMADAYEVNVAPHNFYGHLATVMNAHFCAVAPNLRIMEIDVDTVPWYDDLVTVKPEVKDGHLLLPTGPGWGTAVNEEAVRAHPPKKR